MCRLRNIAMRDYQGSVTTGQTDGQTDAGQSDPYVPICFAGNTKMKSLPNVFLLKSINKYTSSVSIYILSGAG